MTDVIVAISFYFLAFICIIGAIGVVFNKNIVNSGLMLLLTFFSVAGLYLLLNADFIAMAQILIYTVGIAIIVIFAIMLTDPSARQEGFLKRPRAFIAAIASFALLVLLFMSILIDPFLRQEMTNATKICLEQSGTSAIIGKGLFTVYVLPFEIISIVLLIAIIGAIILARRNVEPAKEEQ